MTPVADVCIVVEGCYPFVPGGVSSWLDWLIRSQSETTFAIVAITSDEGPREIKFELPENVISLATLPLHPASKRPRAGNPALNSAAYGEALTDFWRSGSLQSFDRLRAITATPVTRGFPAWLGKARQPDRADLISSPAAWEAVTDCALNLAPEAGFSDFFWAWRALVGGLMSVLTAPIPAARSYHAISTGYAGVFALRAGRETGMRTAITEHGIYTNERRIDLAMAGWLTDRISRGFDLNDSRREVRDLWIEMFEAFSRVSYAGVDRITTLYTANQDFERALGAPEKSLRIIPNGIAPERFDDLVPIRSKQRPVVGLIGRVVPIKDIEAAIQAAVVVRDAIPSVEWLIIGPTEEDPEYFAACQARVMELELEQTVTFTGRLNIMEILPRLDLMILTSISEAQPLVLLEAGAARIPCVATDVGSCREILEGPPGEDPPLGPGGLVVPPMDARAIGAAVVELLLDDRRRKAMGNALRRRVEISYSSEASAAAYRDLYLELCA